MRRNGVAASIVALGALSACTTTQVSGIDESVATYAIGEVSGGYSSDLAADRVQRAQEHRIVESIGRLIELWMEKAGTWGGPDKLHILIDRFRLPNKARWMSAQFKGNDYLGGRQNGIGGQVGRCSVSTFTLNGQGKHAG